MVIRSALRRYSLMAFSVLVVGGAVAYGAVAPNDEAARGVRQAVSPEGKPFPISRAVDPASLVYRGKVGGDHAYLAAGTGPATGMTCLVITTGDITRTACDAPEAVAARGLVMSEDAGSSRLRISGYLPGGVTVAPNADVKASGDFLEGFVPRTQATLRVRRGDTTQELIVPGTEAGR